MYPAGYKSKNARQRMECIKSINTLLTETDDIKNVFGSDPKQLKETIKQIAGLVGSDKDRPTKNQVLDLLCTIGKYIGKSKLEDIVGDMGGEKNKSLLTERIKHANINMDTPKKSGSGAKILKPIQIREHQTAENVDNPPARPQIESNSGGTLRRRNQLPSERTAADLETPMESNFNKIIDPYPLIPDEIKNDPQMLQIWKELGNDSILKECETLNHSIENDNSRLDEMIGNLKLGFDEDEKFFDDLDKEVENIYSKLPLMTRKRLKLAEFAVELVDTLNGSLNESLSQERVHLGENAMTDNLTTLINSDISMSNQSDLFEVIHSVKEIQAYFENPVAIKWLSKNSKLLIVGLTYQLKGLIKSEQLTQANYDDDKIDQDLYLQMGSALVNLLDLSLKNNNIVCSTPVENLKDMFETGSFPGMKHS